MTASNFGKNWENLTIAETGAGSVTVSGGLLTCSSVAGDNAKATRFIYLQPGDTVRVSVMARLVSGSGPIGGIAIVNIGDQARVFVESTDWQRIECTYSLPMTASAAETISINMGVFTTESGTVEYADPKIDLYNSTVAPNRTIACGLIGVASGVPTVNTGYTSHGILGLSYDSGTQELSITIPRSTGAAYSSPLFFMDTTAGGVAAAAPLFAKQSGYDPVTGVVKYKFWNTTGNAFMDISTVASLFAFFKAEIN